MTSVVISAFNVVNYLEGGGHFWVYLQYALGLKQLGCDVWWLERLASSGDEEEDTDRAAALGERLRTYGLDNEPILYLHSKTRPEQPLRYLGRSPSEAESIFEGANLLLNFNYRLDDDLLTKFRRTALVDIDPGLFQFWVSTGQLTVQPHDVYFTTGETVGTAAANFSDCDLQWRHTRPPVCLELWPYDYDPSCEAFTTVSTWWGDEWITDGSDVYENNKRVTFLEFAELPHLTTQSLELALFLGEGDVEDRRVLEENGWRIRHSLEVAATPEEYRAYVQGSRGEFSCVKPSCIRFQNAWISDRSICYLASGKPVVLQDTGPSSFLPDGKGLLRFSTPQEAAEALATINADYELHSRAAREIATTHFDAAGIVETILDVALNEEESTRNQYEVAVSTEDHEEATTQLMIEVLSEGLSELRRRSIVVEELRRKFFLDSSSFRTERLHVVLGEGEELCVFFKDLNPDHQLDVARTVRRAGLDASWREWSMYREVLSRQSFGTPELYASRWMPEQGVMWLFIEDLGDLRLSNVGDLRVWADAARWAARFHARTRTLREAADFLPVFDRDHFQACAKRVRERLPEFGPEEGRSIEEALDCYQTTLDRLEGMPRSIIHGEFYGHNIVVPEANARRELSVIDWESAAIGPSYLDLVSLSTGRWTIEQKRTMSRAYYDEYRAATMEDLDWESFTDDLKCLGLYEAMAWLGWPGRAFADHFERWTQQLKQAVDDLAGSGTEANGSRAGSGKESGGERGLSGMS